MVKYSKRKAPKKRVSRKVRCKRGGMLRSLSKGLASVVRSGRSTKGCKVKSQSKEKIKTCNIFFIFRLVNRDLF